MKKLVGTVLVKLLEVNFDFQLIYQFLFLGSFKPIGFVHGGDLQDDDGSKQQGWLVTLVVI
jgi:hypothetical protein